MQASQATGAKAQKEVKRQKELVSEPEKAKKNSLKKVASLRERSVAAGTREAGLLFSVSAASYQIERIAAELCHTRNMNQTQSKELDKVAKFNPSVRSPEDNVDFNEASEEELKKELAAAIDDHTPLRQLGDEIHAKVLDL